jgi:class 3 adenylate cyclase
MPAATEAPTTKRQPTTVLFVDIVGSTDLAAEIGDERWALLLEEYQAVLRRELATWDGEEMDTAGDGLFAVFVDPAAAVGFGCSVRQAVERLGLRVRVGAHTGTCWVADEKCTGLDVSIGARVVDWAAPDEVLVSASVLERMPDRAGFAFHERGEFELKGVPGPRLLYAVEAKGGAE